MHLYIALYKRTEYSASYHWGLVPSDSTTAPDDSAMVYQIEDSTGEWNLGHRQVQLAKEPQFLGCVKLPPIDATVNDMSMFLAQYGPEQGQSITAGNVAWSCSRWVIRILQDLFDAELLALDVKHMRSDDFHQRITTRGMALEATQGGTEMLVIDY